MDSKKLELIDFILKANADQAGGLWELLINENSDYLVEAVGNDIYEYIKDDIICDLTLNDLKKIMRDRYFVNIDAEDED